MLDEPGNPVLVCAPCTADIPVARPHSVFGKSGAFKVRLHASKETILLDLKCAGGFAENPCYINCAARNTRRQTLCMS